MEFQRHLLTEVAQRMEEERLKAEVEAKEAENLHQSRLEDKRLRELKREAHKIAKSQTSASSMSFVSLTSSSPGANATVDSNSSASDPSTSPQP